LTSTSGIAHGIAKKLYDNRTIMAWIVETLNEVVDAELKELPSDMRARLLTSHV
jgi:hypothetical protein